MQKNNKTIPVILNCDTGIDDAVAIMLAVKSKKLDIKLIVTNVGNVETKQSSQNTLNILELIDAPQIPVVAGEEKCLKQQRPKVAVHGNGGLGEYIFEKNQRKALDCDPTQKMYEIIMASEEKITLICLAPTTNIARLLLKHGDCADKIERIVLMAGSIEEIGENEMPYPEFNIATDPEACEVLLKSKVPIEIVPMEMGHTAYLDWQDVFKTKIQNYTGSVLETIFRSYKDRHVKNGIATHDGCAITYVLFPELFEVKPVYVCVKFFDSIKTGVLVMDFKHEPNAKTCVKVNVKKFKKLYFKCLKHCE